jgi:protein subunit release factor A
MTPVELSDKYTPVCRIESVARERKGMQPVTVWNDVRVKHLPTGIVIEIPHEFHMSQNKKLLTAYKMLQ